MAFIFTNKQVAEIYETDFVHNPKVRVPSQFMGRLADITPEAAERLISQGSNLLTPKKKVADKKGPKPEDTVQS